MVVTWAGVEESNIKPTFVAYHVRIKLVNQPSRIVFRSVFKHHCLRVAKMLNNTPGGVTRWQIDDAAFDRKWD